MSRKEFEDLFAGIQVYMPSLYGKLWQWIEQQIKQARVDELEKILTDRSIINMPTKIQNLLMYRIKELTGELK